MSIIRVVHNKENPYVQLNKAALWDENLSLKATGLWARCMSRPDNWRFNIKELVSKSKEGRRAIDAAIKELIDHNYAVRIEHWEKSDDGKFTTGGVEYVFFEFAATQEDKDRVLEEFKKSFRHCGFGNCRNGDRQNDELLNNNTIMKKEHSLKPPNPQKGEAPEGASEVLAFGKFVNLKKEDHKKLCEDHGFEVVSGLIDEINDYLSSSGKKPYRDYAATIRQWLRRRKQAPQQTQNYQSHHQEKKKWLNLVRDRVKDRRDINFGPENVTFNAGPIALVMKFTDYDIKEQIINRLRKMAVDVSGL